VALEEGVCVSVRRQAQLTDVTPRVNMANHPDHAAMLAMLFSAPRLAPPDAVLAVTA
jgi:hypothetical protein